MLEDTLNTECTNTKTTLIENTKIYKKHLLPVFVVGLRQIARIWDLGLRGDAIRGGLSEGS